jgi:hypothetical protein
VVTYPLRIRAETIAIAGTQPFCILIDPLLFVGLYPLLFATTTTV